MISKKGYYTNQNIRWELIYQLAHRECCFIPIDQETKKSKLPIRWLKAFALSYLDTHFDRYKFYSELMNIYHSLATYSYIPTMSYYYKTKRDQQKEWLKDFKNHIMKYDFFIETDSVDNFEKAKAETIELKEYYDLYKFRYYVKFSGTKGFHLVIEHKEFNHLPVDVYNEKIHENLPLKWENYMKIFPIELKDMKNKTDLVLLFKAIAWRLKLLFALDTVDTSVQDIKRVVKLAYSLDDKSGLIAYPLTDKQLFDFKKEYYTPENVLRMNNFKRRLLFRNEDVDIEERQKNINKMLVEIGILK